MIFNTIMVHLDVGSPAAPRLEFGLELAHRFEADLIAFAAAEARLAAPPGDSDIAAARAMRRQMEEVETRLEALEKEFQSVANDDPRASWRAHIGDPTAMLALHARAADLVIVGCSKHGRSRGAIDAGALILSAGRPIFLHSDDLTPVRLDDVVVGWKDTPEARRAVVDSLPFLTQAKNVLVAAVDDVDPNAARDSASDVVRYLMRHGARARCEVVELGKSRVADTLSELAFENGANLIVAGGYGHSRLREWAFGGTTRSLLADGSLHRLLSN